MYKRQVYKEYAEFIKQYEKEYSDLKKEIDNLSNTKGDLDLGMNTFKELLINSKIFDDNERNLELEFKVFKEKKVLEEEKSVSYTHLDVYKRQALILSIHSQHSTKIC